MKLITMLALLTMLLPTLGAVSAFLDTIAPEQLIDVVDNPDGTFTAIYRG